MDYAYAEEKLTALLLDLSNYTVDEFRRQMARIITGATGQDVPDDCHTIKAERDALALEVDEANERNAQLVEERDALAAHALALKELSEFWINQAKPQPDCSKQDYNLWLALGYKSKALTQTPKQYLHDLKVAAYQQACVDFCAVDSGALSDLQPLIDQYSERLKAEDVCHERQLFRVAG